MRTASGTASNWVHSCPGPAVTTTARGSRLASHARCTLRPNPPRPRPSPWSAGSPGRRAFPPAGGPGRPHGGAVHRVRGVVDQPDRIQPGLPPLDHPSMARLARGALNRWSTVCHGPYRSGGSRHAAPVASRQEVALATVRSSRHRPPRPCRRGGKNSAGSPHSRSDGTCRLMTTSSVPGRRTIHRTEPGCHGAASASWTRSTGRPANTRPDCRMNCRRVSRTAVTNPRAYNAAGGDMPANSAGSAVALPVLWELPRPHDTD
jgi:hypothetical protein